MGVLEVLPCVVEAAGPHLRDAEIHERERPVVGPHGRPFGVRRRVEGCLELAQGSLGLGQIVAPAAITTFPMIVQSGCTNAPGSICGTMSASA